MGNSNEKPLQKTPGCDTVSHLTLARLAVHEWNSEDEAIHEICGHEADLREKRWEQWDRVLAFKLQFVKDDDPGPVQRLATALGVDRRTIQRWTKAAEKIPADLRHPDLNSVVYYRASRDDDALAALREVVESGGTEADYWQAVGKESPEVRDFCELLQLAEGKAPAKRAMKVRKNMIASRNGKHPADAIMRKDPKDMTSYEHAFALSSVQFEAATEVGRILLAIKRWKAEGMPWLESWALQAPVREVRAVLDLEAELRQEDLILSDLTLLPEVPEEAARQWVRDEVSAERELTMGRAVDFARRYVEGQTVAT